MIILHKVHNAASLLRTGPEQADPSLDSGTTRPSTLPAFMSDIPFALLNSV